MGGYGIIMARHFLDLTGEKFNRLTVLEFSKKGNRGRTYWKCICDCGNITVVSTDDLRSGHSKSCGCLQREKIRGNTNRRKGFGESSVNTLYYKYKQNANNRGKIFELSKDEFICITGKQCFYCGKHPSSVFTSKNFFGEYIYNGVDRFINSIGYTIENSVPCCAECNFAKGTLDGPEYLALCRRVSEHWNNRDMEQEKKAA